MTEKTMHAIGQGFYKTMFEISHHYNKTFGSANVQFFLFLYVIKVGMVLMPLTFRQLEHLHPTPANTPFH